MRSNDKGKGLREEDEKEAQEPRDRAFHLYVHAHVPTSAHTADILVPYIQLQLPECRGVLPKRKERTGVIINSIELR